jgi:hypothetical protein
MEKGQLRATPLLDTHGRIGPFFFKEFFVILLGVSFLFFAVLIVDLFTPVRKSLPILVPSSFLIIVAAIRLFFIKKIDSPWYMHTWVAYRFLWPKSIKADSFAIKRKVEKRAP